MKSIYVLVSKVAEMQKRWELDQDLLPSEPFTHPTIGAGDIAPVLMAGSKKKISTLRFGLEENGKIITSLRSEGDRNQANDWNYRGLMGIVNGKYRQKVLHQRCAVICDAYIGGMGNGIPYLVYPRDKQRPFLLAGIHDNTSFALLTIWGNILSQKIGDVRTPVVLNGKDIYHWLNPNYASLGIGSHLKPFNHFHYNAYPVNPDILDINNKNVKLLNPIGSKLFEETNERRARQEIELAARRKQEKEERDREESASYSRHIQKLRDQGLIP